VLYWFLALPKPDPVHWKSATKECTLQNYNVGNPQNKDCGLWNDLTANEDRYSRDKWNENTEVIKNFIFILVTNIIIFAFLIHSKTKFFATI